MKDPKTITIPKPSDLLIITNDGAVSKGGMGSILYILRDGTLHLGGYFSAKLKSHQLKWLPCEMEALAITSALNHWGPYILESQQITQVLTDSKPCIQAYGKLSRGEFSSSARVSTFLSTLSKYRITLQHLAGSANLPADYLSRNPMECTTHDCQICSFISTNTHSTICSISVNDVTENKTPMPFTNIVAWKQPQQDCPDLRRTYSHLSQGTRPTKKMSKIKDVKRYLRVATIGREGVLIVKSIVPFAPSRNLTVIPRHILPGLLTALHLRFQHPTSFQLQKVFHRHFYALDADKAIKSVTNNCAHCASLAQLPLEITSSSTSVPAPRPGISFACDVLCRSRQKLFVIRDTFSSFTAVRIIPDEQSSSLRSAIIETTADLLTPAGATLRVDGGTGFQSLVHDVTLTGLGLLLEVGRLKNKNKNPVAEKAVQELEVELKKQNPEGGPVTPAQLATVVATLNARVRNRGLCAKEILFQRDHITGEQLNFTDSQLALQQHHLRLQNHGPSAISKARGGRPAFDADISPGDLVYVKEDGTKHVARDRYIVTACNSDFITAHKLVGTQFRSKEYQLKYSEVYPVPCATIPSHAHLPPRTSPYDSDSSEESEVSVDITVRPDITVLPHARPPPERDRSPQSSTNPGTNQTAPSRSTPSADANITSRSQRFHRKPAWMRTDEWQY